MYQVLSWNVYRILARPQRGAILLGKNMSRKDAEKLRDKLKGTYPFDLIGIGPCNVRG